MTCPQGILYGQRVGLLRPCNSKETPPQPRNTKIIRGKISVGLVANMSLSFKMVAPITRSTMNSQVLFLGVDPVFRK